MKQPLFGMEFFIFGQTKKPQAEIIHKIHFMGGKLAKNVHRELTAVISNANEVDEPGEMIQEAITRRIQVIGDEFLDDVMNDDPIKLIVKNDLSKRGHDVRFFLIICLTFLLVIPLLKNNYQNKRFF